MSQAKDLLTSILSSALGGQIQAGQVQGASDFMLLSATTVTKPPPIVSVQTFNAQLSIGGKDEALRKASNLFRTAAESMGRSRARGEKYWVDALRARRANWGLSPAPLPPGSATGKGADKTSKDFIISYGLEGCACLNEIWSKNLSLMFLSSSQFPSSCYCTNAYCRKYFTATCISLSSEHSVADVAYLREWIKNRLYYLCSPQLPRQHGS